jgi:hypothetical protein
VGTGHPSVQELVGGRFLDYVWLSDDIHAYVNDEGRYMHLPVNGRGNEIVNGFCGRQSTPLGCELLGTMIFLSMDDEGREASLTDDQLARILSFTH